MFAAADRPPARQSAPEETGAAGTLTGLPGAAGEDACAPAATESPWTHLGHELRTPLHAILGNVELLVDGSAGPLSADARACLGDVQNAGRQLLRQVDLMLLLIQAEATPEPGVEDEVDFLGRMRDMLQGHVADGALEPTGGRLVLRGDPFWLGTWAHALVEAWLLEGSRSTGSPVRVERVADPAPHEVGLRIAGTGGKAPAPSPVASMLIDAIVRLHGGRILPEAGAGLCLAWPTSRLVAWQTG